MKYDGVLCFGGEDYWYHNRGHYDMQMMREFSRDTKVLYVNSIGMRVPNLKEGKVFWARVARKLRSFTRGLRKVHKNFYVFSPIFIPGMNNSSFGLWFLEIQLRFVLYILSIRRPLFWIAVPTAAHILKKKRTSGMIYQRTDRMEEYHGVDKSVISGLDRTAKQAADITLYCSSELFRIEKEQCKNAMFVDHGVDFDYFHCASSMENIPPDVATISHPRVGFIGGIDAHTFDPDLFNQVVRLLPDFNFFLVGGCSLPEGWCKSQNVFLLGRKDYSDVADYMAAADVLIMPWNDSEWIKACNPVKMKEYLAVGKPIVSTFFWELEKYRDYISIAVTPEEFAEKIRDVYENPADSLYLSNRVKNETWENKGNIVKNAISEK